MPLDEEILEQLRALMRLAQEHRLTEITLEDAVGMVRVRRRERRRVVRRPEAAPAPGGRHEIRAPLVGVFYRASAPGVPPYVEVGDVIERGQTVGLIEAMKVFNEINSEVEGRVVAIPARDGELVQAGDLLMIVEPASSR